MPLREFTASYELHKGYLHIATTDISLRQVGPLWRWRTTTVARGIYALFINNKPTSETTFIQVNDEIRLQQILYSDPGDKKKYEATSFDWGKGSVNVLRKGKHKQLPLVTEVYDYHSIHLLATAMHMQQLDRVTVDFYRKGRISRSELVHIGTGNIVIDDKTVNASIYQQTVVKSSSKLKYFYGSENPVLPLRVEKSKPGESPITLTLRKVDWNL